MTRLTPAELASATVLANRLKELDRWLLQVGATCPPKSVRDHYQGHDITIEIPPALVRQAASEEHYRIISALSDMGIEVDCDGGAQ